MELEPSYRLTRFGFDVHVDEELGHLWVLHDGSITWDQLQNIKDKIWGPETSAAEFYPPQSKVINNCNCRHLWRLGATDFVPDLLGNDTAQDSLQARHAIAWAEAQAN
jgi:hypothetical protein